MKRQSSRLLLSILLAGLAPSFLRAEWPAVTRDARPWTRWWWLGNIGDRGTFSEEMEKYAAAGFGGLEITPIYGVRGQEERFVPFLSSTWVGNFRHVLAEGRRLRLGLDLSTGTGWPFGGPSVGEADAARRLEHRRFTVAAGQRLNEPVTLVQTPLVRYAGPRRTPLAELKQPLSANSDLQDLALDQVRFPVRAPLVALLAYPPGGDAPTDLTARVGPDGQLNWTAPAASGRGAASNAGAWTLYALFSGQHGKLVERAAPGGEGYALDHFSSSALGRYLQGFDRAFHGRADAGLRAYFNDSYEVDDAQGDADFTPAFFTEFKRRRGYDLRQELPALLDPAADAERARRVHSDYRETISDLLRDRFTQPWRAWAHGRGALIRNQAHGSPANLLDLYAISDIPEQEGTDLFAIKLASSAAHLAGKRLASAEAATWLNEHWLTTFAELKESIDTFFLGGINHVCYHGTAFSPESEPWPGFQFYASVELSPTNPLWENLPAFNAYVTRVQSFLQSGQPDEPLLLYYSPYDRWAQPGQGLPHFHGIGSGAKNDGMRVLDTARRLHAAGYGFDYVSDRLLGPARYEGNALALGSGRYQAIVVPETVHMPVATLRKLVELAERGATVVFEAALPSDVPGLSDLANARRELQALRDRINAAPVEDGARTIGRGRILVAGDAATALPDQVSTVPQETLNRAGLAFLRRRNEHDQTYYFLVNRSARPLDQWVTFQTPGSTAELLDPQTGRCGRAAVRHLGAGAEVYLQLSPGASAILLFRPTEPGENPWEYRTAAGPAVALNGPWSLQFLRGGPTLPEPISPIALGSWTALSREGVTAFSGTAAFTTTFPRPGPDAAAWRLDLGDVRDNARIFLNGRELAVLLQPPWTIDLSSAMLTASNDLRVEITNLAANRIADLDRRGVAWKRFYNVNLPAKVRENQGPDGLFTARQWAPRPSGLLGPVTLTPLAPSTLP